jgi:hypothetical protein
MVDFKIEGIELFVNRLTQRGRLRFLGVARRGMEDKRSPGKVAARPKHRAMWLVDSLALG